jgi:GntR family transcriptional repressor for pyruvate dehydrogenase complex
VGISTVHEATKALGAVGLVESRPGKGTWVRHDALDSTIHPAFIANRFGPIEVETIYEARLVMETALSELAAQKATPEDLQVIWDGIDALHSAGTDDQQFIEADWAFHMAVARAGHNLLLESFYRLSRDLLLEFIADAIRLPRVKEEAPVFHVALAKAIEAHDPVKAREATVGHMLYVKDRLMI